MGILESIKNYDAYESDFGRIWEATVAKFKKDPHLRKLESNLNVVSNAPLNPKKGFFVSVKRAHAKAVAEHQINIQTAERELMEFRQSTQGIAAIKQQASLNTEFRKLQTDRMSMRTDLAKEIKDHIDSTKLSEAPVQLYAIQYAETLKRNAAAKLKRMLNDGNHYSMDWEELEFSENKQYVLWLHEGRNEFNNPKQSAPSKQPKQRAQYDIKQERLEGTRLAKTIPYHKDDPCPYCGDPLGRSPHHDHIVPIKQGGISVITNIVWVCNACNLEKGSNSIQDFALRNEHARSYQDIVSTLKEMGKM